MIARVAQKDATGALTERLKTDPEKAIRAEALVQLDRLGTLEKDALIALSKDPDEGVRMLTARAPAAKKNSKTPRAKSCCP